MAAALCVVQTIVGVRLEAVGCCLKDCCKRSFSSQEENGAELKTLKFQDANFNI